MKKNTYFESTVDSNKVISQSGNVIIASDNKYMLFWLDKYVLLSNQKAQVDKYLINGKWYKQTDSVYCLDLRPKRQLLLNQINSLNKS